MKRKSALHLLIGFGFILPTWGSAGALEISPGARAEERFNQVATDAAASSVSAYTDALNALQMVQVIAHEGASFRDYTPKVLDAKIKVDKYLATTPGGQASTPSAIRAAMQFYQVAAQAWNIQLKGRRANSLDNKALGEAVLKDPDVSGCPGIAALIASSQKAAGENTASSSGKPDATSVGTLAAVNVSVFWVCASGKIAAAEAPKP